MNKNILVGIQAINESISVLNIKPFDLAFHAGSQNFLFSMFFLSITTVRVLIVLSFGHI